MYRFIFDYTAKQHSSTLNPQEQSFLTKKDIAQQGKELYKLN